jgi:hypothetical protein
MMPDRHAEIARRAYSLWEQEGRPTGKDLDHWLRAEADIAASWRVQPRREEAAAPRRPATKRGAAKRRRKAPAST